MSSLPDSPYMEWAKTRSQAPFNLAGSGMAAFALADLPWRAEDVELTGNSFYGYPPLLERLARKAGVSPDCVVAATGTSMANFLVMAALLEPGQEVLIEEPTYPLFVDVARWLRAEVRRFPRRFEDGFRLDPAAVAAAISPRTRLVVVSNMHNPSGALAGEGELKAVGEIARGAKARVLVDEVYLEGLALVGPPARSAFHLGPEFVATASLTKAYGLSGLRCGWVLADPDLARRMWRLDDLFGVVPAHPAERLSVVALDHLERVIARARAILSANHGEAGRFLQGRKDLESIPIGPGMVAFPRLVRGQVEALLDRLRERHQTTLAPGRFFGAAGHFRLSLGAPPETLQEGLRRLGLALDEGRGEAESEPPDPRLT